jgi:hypothetical protein
MEAQRMTTTFETDSVSITVPITREDTGEAVDLTGATLQAIAQRSGGAPIVATVTVTNPASGVARVSWPPETFTPVSYDWQLRVTINGEVQTVVSDTITAQRSLRAAP